MKLQRKEDLTKALKHISTLNLKNMLIAGYMDGRWYIDNSISEASIPILPPDFRVVINIDRNKDTWNNDKKILDFIDNLEQIISEDFNLPEIEKIEITNTDNLKEEKKQIARLTNKLDAIRDFKQSLINECYELNKEFKRLPNYCQNEILQVLERNRQVFTKQRLDLRELVEKGEI
jgi:hypothetical protein